MNHATIIPSFISPVTPPAGDKAEAVFLPRLIVSAINSRLTAVYLRMSVFIQYAQRNFSHWLHALVAPVTSQVVADLKRNKGATHERGNFIQERGYFSHARGFFSQGADDD